MTAIIELVSKLTGSKADRDTVASMADAYRDAAAFRAEVAAGWSKGVRDPLISERSQEIAAIEAEANSRKASLLAAISDQLRAYSYSLPHAKKEEPAQTDLIAHIARVSERV